MHFPRPPARVRATRIVIAIAAILAIGGCSDRAPSRSAGAPGDTSRSTAIRLRSERTAPLGDGGAPVRLALDAIGPTLDSLAVHLEARDGAGRVAYARDWRSDDFLNCECDSTERAAALPPLERETRRYLAHAFDSAIVAPQPDSGRYWERPDHRLAVMLQLVPQLWTLAPIAGVDTTATLAALRAERPTRYDSLAARIMAGIRTRPAMVYRTGVEGYCIVAWASELRRMVDVLCGP